MFRRFARMDAPEIAEGNLRLDMSSDAAIDMGGWREVLSHAEGAVDTSAATALLINHDPNRIAGSLRGCSLDGKRMCGEAKLMEGARMDSGVLVADAIASGALRGISIGYTYDRADTTYDEKARTLSVSKWRLLEASLTPIPADASAGLRSIPFGITMSTPDPVAPVASAPATRDAAKAIATRAEACGLKASDFLHLDEPAANAAILDAVQSKMRAAVSEPDAPIVAAATVTEDDADKQVSAIGDAIMARTGLGQVKSGNPYAGRRLRQMAAIFAERSGIRSARDWTDKEQAHFFLGELGQIPSMRRDAANKTVSNFPNFVFLDAITKVVAKGFEMAPRGLMSQSGAKIYAEQTVPDFKNYNLGGLGTGLLTETAENIAFPELTQTEGVYSSVAKMWGGTLSLTLQAVINDDTGSFDRALRQAGPIAQKTIDKRLVQKFLRGIASTDTSTWTSNTTSGCTPVWTTADTLAAARANIGKANAALGQKLGLDGQPTCNMARFLFAPPTAGLFLGGLLNQATGQTVSNVGQFELVVSPWLEASAVTGNSSTSYYAVADPALVDGLILTKIAGFETVQVQEYDAGAVGARKWKIWHPFEADLIHFANSAGTDTIYAAQQATT